MTLQGATDGVIAAGTHTMEVGGQCATGTFTGTGFADGYSTGTVVALGG